MKRRFCALLLALTLVPPAHADGLPDLGEVGVEDLSPMAERRIGEHAMRDIRWRNAAYLDDPEVEDYLAHLGGQLAAGAPASAPQFTFFAVRDLSLNAFALPGGFIGVHAGLMLAAQGESELAAVLGHEIAHVTQRHIARLVGNRGRTGLVMLASLIVAVLAARSSADAAQAAVATGQAVGLQSQLSFTRQFEREADRIGLQLLEGAGFDVRGMPAFFERLQRNSRLYENNAPAYLRTHPLTSQRISDITNRIDGLRYRQRPDSLGFRLVRAKLAVLATDARAPVAEVSARLGPSDKVARAYAHARAHLRAGRLPAAQKALAVLRGWRLASPMIETLAGEILTAQGKTALAVEHYQRALARFPGQRTLRAALAESQLSAGHPERAIDVLRDALVAGSNDHRLWALQARAQAQVGNLAGRHRAQGEVYRIQGALQAAVDQFELAQRSAGADFFAASAIDARLRALRKQLHEESPGERSRGG